MRARPSRELLRHPLLPKSSSRSVLASPASPARELPRPLAHATLQKIKLRFASLPKKAVSPRSRTQSSAIRRIGRELRRSSALTRELEEHSSVRPQPMPAPPTSPPLGSHSRFLPVRHSRPCRVTHEASHDQELGRSRSLHPRSELPKTPVACITWRKHSAIPKTPCLTPLSL